MLNNKNIFYGEVKDVNDPLGIGRIRVEPKIELITYVYPVDWDPNVDKWTLKDPLVFLPLLPMYISQIPKEGEYVNIMYANNKERYDGNKFYIQGPLSRPWNVSKESFISSQSVLASLENSSQATSTIDPQTGKVRVSLEGVFPKPGDNAFLGRGSSDLVMVENSTDGSSSALLRSGKFLSSGNENIPVKKNDGRSFLQLSSYQLENVDAGTDVIEREVFEDIQTKYYVEWSLDNTSTTATTYDGKVKLYSLPKDNENTKVSQINESVNILNNISINPLYTLTFTGKTLGDASEIINDFITGVNEGKIQVDGYINYPAGDGESLFKQFPFFYGPSYDTYQYFNDINDAINDLQLTLKVKLLYNNITLSKGYTERGSGLVWKKTPPKLGILKNPITDRVKKRDYISNPVTYSVMGGDKLYLLTHRSSGKFAINLKDTLYGIPQQMLATQLETKTNSMVRGEEIISFLSLLTRFVLFHVHPFPGVPPVPTASDGTLASEILQRLATADNIILNKNIRIN
jgi:hypothetical protein